MKGVHPDCPTYVLHPRQTHIVAMHDRVIPERAKEVWNMVLQIKAILRKPPFALDFAPPQAFLFQMGDGASMEKPSVGFCTREGLPAVRLVPDPYFHRSTGFQELRWLAERRELPPWHKRERSVFWRGTATGGLGLGPGGWRDIPRIRLVLLCAGRRWADVKISHVPAQLRPHHDPQLVAAELRRANLMAGRLQMPEFATRRYTVDIDGNTNAWGLFEKMLLGLCILKVESPWSQWFYDRLTPWQHYVPVRADLSDLPDLVEWCLANDAEAAAIAEQAQRLALGMSFAAEMRGAADAVASVLMPYDPRAFDEDAPSVRRADGH